MLNINTSYLDYDESMNPSPVMSTTNKGIEEKKLAQIYYSEQVKAASRNSSPLSKKHEKYIKNLKKNESM